MKVVGRCGCGGQQPVRHLAHEVGDLIAAGAVKALEDAALIANHAGKVGGVEMLKPLVVGDHNAARHGAITAALTLNAELLTLSDGLRSNRQRGQDQHRLVQCDGPRSQPM
jgi:hypothetical protein